MSYFIICSGSCYHIQQIHKILIHCDCLLHKVILWNQVWVTQNKSNMSEQHGIKNNGVPIYESRIWQITDTAIHLFHFDSKEALVL